MEAKQEGLSNASVRISGTAIIGSKQQEELPSPQPGLEKAWRWRAVERHKARETWITLAQEWNTSQKSIRWDFPGGPVVKNPLANAGDSGSIPGSGRFHMPWGN